MDYTKGEHIVGLTDRGKIIADMLRGIIMEANRTDVAIRQLMNDNRLEENDNDKPSDGSVEDGKA